MNTTTATTALFQAYTLLEDVSDEAARTHAVAVLHCITRGKIAEATRALLVMADDVEMEADLFQVGSETHAAMVDAVRDARAAL